MEQFFQVWFLSSTYLLSHRFLFLLLIIDGNILYQRVQMYARISFLFPFSHLGTISDSDETIKDGVCHGLKYRTIAMVGSCNDLLANLQLSVLSKLGWEPKVGDFSIKKQASKKNNSGARMDPIFHFNIFVYFVRCSPFHLYSIDILQCNWNKVSLYYYKNLRVMA